MEDLLMKFLKLFLLINFEELLNFLNILESIGILFL